MPSVTESTLTGQLRARAVTLERDAGRLDRRGKYRMACDTLRLVDLMREVACGLEQWETRESDLKVPRPGESDPATADMAIDRGIDR
jgi:hypothetical protein